MENNQATGGPQPDQRRLMHEVVFLHTERLNILTGHINTLMSQVAWSETCFRDVKDCGVIQLAEPLKASIEEVKRLKVQHQALSHRIKSIITMLEGQEEQEGGSDQAPQAQPSTLSKKYGR